LVHINPTLLPNEGNSSLADLKAKNM
jgi:hypothetical protein